MSDPVDAVREILAVFDDDPQMTRYILAAEAGDQQTAQDAALVRIREIARAAGRAPAADAEVPGMHEHSWDLTAAQDRALANPSGGRPSGARYTNVLGRCRGCGEPGSWTLAGSWTLDQVTGAAS